MVRWWVSEFFLCGEFSSPADPKKKKKKSWRIHLVYQDSRHLLIINAEDPRQYTYVRNLKQKTLVAQKVCVQFFFFFLWLAREATVCHVPTVCRG